MGIRIRRAEIKITSAEPFKNDLLNRKELVEVLANLIGSVEGPCVLAINGEWGSGKSTFLKICSKYLHNKGFPIVAFNAWENDFSDNPFVSLVTELTNNLQKDSNQKITEFINNAKKIIPLFAPPLIRFLTSCPSSIENVLKEGFDKSLASYAERQPDKHREAQTSVQEFKRQLQEMVNDVLKSKGGRPVIVMIDELDRCRPSYAVELLEVAKHLFSTNGVIFVLAINRSQLVHSIKALYGNEFDAFGYLQRFIDIDYQLPSPKRDEFIRKVLVDVGIESYFLQTSDQDSKEDFNIICSMLEVFFNVPELSLRQIEQAISRLGLMFGALHSDRYALALATTVALIFRTIYPELYHEFRRGETSDQKVIKAIFENPSFRPIHKTEEGRMFEAVIISGTPAGNEFSLLKQYRQLNEETTLDSPERDHASIVLGFANRFLRKHGHNKSFLYAANRIELLSKDLIYQDEQDEA